MNNATATIKVKLPACKRHRKEWWNCFYLLALLNSMNVESVYLASSGFYLVQHQQSRHKIYSHNNGMFAGLNFSNFHSRLGKLCVCACEFNELTILKKTNNENSSQEIAKWKYQSTIYVGLSFCTQHWFPHAYK